MCKAICKDEDGNLFLSFENIPEAALSGMPELTHCLAVVRLGGDYLLGWNNWRGRYEIFGGCRENGESARNCIVRELREELGITLTNVNYLGAMRFLMQPDYFSPETRIELGGLYGVTLEISLDLLHSMVKDCDEIGKLALYSEVKDKAPIALIDELLLGWGKAE